ncbi:hypothetical protein ACFV5G_40530, partial [Streptomyces sp. NPDC059766]
MEAGLLVLRLVAGLLVAGHGVQKVSYRLGGHGLAGGTEEFRHDGFRGGRLSGVVAGAPQFGGRRVDCPRRDPRPGPAGGQGGGEG